MASQSFVSLSVSILSPFPSRYSCHTPRAIEEMLAQPIPVSWYLKLLMSMARLDMDLEDIPTESR